MPAMIQEHYRFACSFGVFEIALNHAKAPETCRYFANAFDRNTFSEASIFRIVTAENSSVNTAAPIEVVQIGHKHDEGQPLDPLRHESTQVTGLKHDRWALSAARYDVEQAYESCFICMRDEPALDYGGKRHPDGQGFAVFGRVTGGFETLEAVFAKAEEADFLSQPIPIERH